MQPDWNASSGLGEILNKPSIPSAYTLPAATTSTLGGVIPDGTTITVDANGNPYYTHDEVNAMLDQLDAGNGFWDRTDAELNQMAADIKAVCGL